MLVKRKQFLILLKNLFLLFEMITLKVSYRVFDRLDMMPNGMLIKLRQTRKRKNPNKFKSKKYFLQKCFMQVGLFFF